MEWKFGPRSAQLVYASLPLSMGMGTEGRSDMIPSSSPSSPTCPLLLSPCLFPCCVVKLWLVKNIRRGLGLQPANDICFLQQYKFLSQSYDFALIEFHLPPNRRLADLLSERERIEEKSLFSVPPSALSNPLPSLPPPVVMLWPEPEHHSLLRPSHIPSSLSFSPI